MLRWTFACDEVELGGSEPPAEGSKCLSFPADAAIVATSRPLPPAPRGLSSGRYICARRCLIGQVGVGGPKDTCATSTI